jgi:hypothetical protein
VTRILQFSDGFTSSTAPTISGGSSEELVNIADNTLSGSVSSFDSTLYTSAFINYDLFRTDGASDYTQKGTFIVSFDGTSWSFQLGNYVGDSMIVETVPSTFEISLSINVSTGEMTYRSGSLGGTYSGKLTLSITRITA